MLGTVELNDLLAAFLNFVIAGTLRTFSAKPSIFSATFSLAS